MSTPSPNRIDRRVAIKWMLTASASALLVNVNSLRGASMPDAGAAGPGYGVDPDLMKQYKPGDVWALTFTDGQRRAASALCDVILPADDVSPSASTVGVPDFIDEWVSAPYPTFAADRKVIVAGLAWIDSESTKRFGAVFADASDAQRTALCEDLTHLIPEDPALKEPTAFFIRFRELTAAGFYTTPVGMKDIGYVGNVPLAKFDGPPADLIAKMGLQDEVKW